MNQTHALQSGIDEAAEIGYFVDDERTMTALPQKLGLQAKAAQAGRDHSEPLLRIRRRH